MRNERQGWDHVRDGMHITKGIGMDREFKNIDDLMDSIKDNMVRKDLVYTLLIKAWDLGFCEGCEEAQEQYRRSAEY